MRLTLALAVAATIFALAGRLADIYRLDLRVLVGMATATFFVALLTAIVE